MDVVVTLEGRRFFRTPDGAVWTPTPFTYDFFARYLEVFDGVKALARVAPAAAPPADAVRADGARVRFAGLPYYVGPWQYLRVRGRLGRVLLEALAPDDAVILRLPSTLAAPLAEHLARAGRPWAAEVVGDPHDVFAPGASRHPLRFFFRWFSARRLRRDCARAAAVAYVTRAALQRRYPPAPGAYTTYYSDVWLPEANFVAAPLPPRLAAAAGPWRLIFVGNLEQLYKAPDVLLEAVARAVQGGLDLELTLVGDGQARPELEALAARLGLGARARFLGRLGAGAAVREQLDRAELFVLPSYQEGLPRAMLEAMARGLPCLGSTVGGIPELLEPEDLVPPGDAAALAAKLREVLADPARLGRMAARNLTRAREYRADLLRERRLAFYRRLRELTAAWLAAPTPDDPARPAMDGNGVATEDARSRGDA